MNYNSNLKSKQIKKIEELQEKGYWLSVSNKFFFTYDEKELEPKDNKQKKQIRISYMIHSSNEIHGLFQKHKKEYPDDSIYGHFEAIHINDSLDCIFHYLKKMFVMKINVKKYLQTLKLFYHQVLLQTFKQNQVNTPYTLNHKDQEIIHLNKQY